LPVAKEYVVDIDISDYDNVRFCGCKEAKFCTKCWPLMTCGMKVLDHLLSDCFGFDQKLWIYSGRRGIHCWVSDAQARAMDNEARSAVTEFLHIYVGSEKTGKKLTLSRFLHPTFGMNSQVFEICEAYFMSMYCDTDGEDSMNIFESKEKWEKIVELIDGMCVIVLCYCITN
jgi:DNA primase small subunit